MQVSLVTPEREIFSGDADSVQIPGMEGDMTIMGNHAALVTTLRPGVVRVTGGSAEGEYVVTGGFAEISAEGASVLAEQAMPRAEATSEVLNTVLTEVTAAAEIADGDAAITARQRINDVAELMKRLA